MIWNFSWSLAFLNKISKIFHTLQFKIWIIYGFTNLSFSEVLYGSSEVSNLIYLFIILFFARYLFIYFYFLDFLILILSFVVYSMNWFNSIFRISLFHVFYSLIKNSLIKMKYFLLEKTLWPISVIHKTCNRVHNIVEIFDVLTSFFFASSEQERDY